MVDFDGQQPLLYDLDSLYQHSIRVQFPNFCTPHTESTCTSNTHKNLALSKNPASFNSYNDSFQIVMNSLQYGNSFLTNLTASTPISINKSLDEIYTIAKAKYKIQFDQSWICFSPETFVQIKSGIIASYPMKGTIDASIPDAASVILNDPKETAEHYTIVDLIRNDIAQVATHVEVKRFRYIDEIKTKDTTLLQVSSEISGKLPNNYLAQLGNIIFALLPAGSISGAPKKKTIEIIHQAEQHTRGFYTGVAFYFDGKDLDSCVLIRFIENTPNGLVYKSGGGITINSKALEEYQELIAKIYVPCF